MAAARRSERAAKIAVLQENMATRAANARRPLGDIGNLVGAMAVRCHVSKDVAVNPIKQDVATSWGAKQRRTEESLKSEESGGEVGSGISDAQSSTESDAAAIPLPAPPGQQPRMKALSRNGRPAATTKWPTMTARLTAISQSIEKDTPMIDVDEHLPNIDEGDAEDQLCVVDYVEDIYTFYRKAEVTSCVCPEYMCRQNDINDKMRAILIDWLIEVHLKFRLMPETLFLTTNLIDRYLSVENVPRKTLQLVGVTAMLLAAKYEEIIAPEVAAIVYISDDAYTRQQVLDMEKAMLNTLGFNLTVPTPYVFIMRFLKAADSDKQMDMLAFFFVELCLTEYSAVKFSPSLLAAAAVYTAHHTLRKLPLWTPSLVRHSGFSESQLRDCATMMMGLHRKAAEGQLVVVHKKYSGSKFQSVATLAPATLDCDSGSESLVELSLSE